MLLETFGDDPRHLSRRHSIEYWNFSIIHLMSLVRNCCWNIQKTDCRERNGATKYRKNDLRRTFFSLCMCEHCEGCLSELSSSYLRFIRLKLIFFSQFMKGFTVNLRIEHLQPNKREKNEMEKVFSRIGPSIIILAAVSLNIVVKEPANRTEEAPSKSSWGY